MISMGKLVDFKKSNILFVFDVLAFLALSR